MSDLHLESNPQFRPRPAAGAQLLVLAGDIGSYQRASRLDDPDFGLGRCSPRHGWPCPVLYVPGNHEYDNLDFDATHARLRETCERLGITHRTVYHPSGINNANPRTACTTEMLQGAWRDLSDSASH